MGRKVPVARPWRIARESLDGSRFLTETIRLALATFLIGFTIEGATEIYQFVSYDVNQPGWVGFTYLGLATTIFGFYVMYRGRHEWTDLHRKNIHRGHKFLWTAAAIFGVAVLGIAVLGSVHGAAAASSTPPVVAWTIGGLIALAIANFFLGLAVLVDHLVGRSGKVLAWSGFGWSLGVAILAGAMIGAQFTTLFVAFFTAPIRLFTDFGPLTYFLSPLFVSYGLLAVAYFEALRRLPRVAGLGRSVPPSAPPAVPPTSPPSDASSPAPAKAPERAAPTEEPGL
ncbi:MAG: hypothetical protein KGI89_08930 [Euryarchaeota archaeon]|nr:hypothetical protein [Euryarchaeota archaeon]